MLKKKCAHYLFVLLSYAIVTGVVVNQPAEAESPEAVWHADLYRDGTGWWRNRARLVIENKTAEALQGRALELKIDDGPKSLACAGARAEGVGLCMADGVELLYRILGPDGKLIPSGAIPKGSRMVVPVDCPAGGSTELYVYWNNPLAGGYPDVLGDKAAEVSAATKDAIAKGKILVNLARPQVMELKEAGKDAPWFDDNPGDDIHWDYRVGLRVCNASAQDRSSAHAAVNLSLLKARLGQKVNDASIRVTRGDKPVKFFRSGNMLIFESNVDPQTAQEFFVYFSDDSRIQPSGEISYAEAVASKYNLVRNPSFELGDKRPDDWSLSVTTPPKNKAKGVEAQLCDSPAPDLGRYSARLHVPSGTIKGWRGWHQMIELHKNRSYYVSGWIKCENLRSARGEHDPQGESHHQTASIHLHLINSKGVVKRFFNTQNPGHSLLGTADWTLLDQMFSTTTDQHRLGIHLTTEGTGTLWHDGMLLLEIDRVGVLRPQSRPQGKRADIEVWPVNAVVKVFQETFPPENKPAAGISLARNEKEPLQLAIRSVKNFGKVRVEVDTPVNAAGEKIDDIEVGVVGYVPVDYPTSYYHATTPPWYLKRPDATPRSDGWPGMWPDPLLPRDHFQLDALHTQAIWITVGADQRTTAGDYRGRVRFVAEDKHVLVETPFDVHVWDFTLPDESHVKAIYDLRFGPAGMSLWSKGYEETKNRILRFMSQRRLSAHQVLPDPKITYENGEAKADFSEFDKAAAYYFDELKLPVSYAPHAFYLFGWGHPPWTRFGEQPYPGKHPYKDADRAKLNPEYKKRYQACLKLFWDHIKAKGWDKKTVLYLCDEPFFQRNEILAQMKALCDMIHEVDPKIRIYSSTWHHVPQWDGYLDIWGLSHFGWVPVEQFRKIQAAGDTVWFTTDGQMCLDTPYCAVERMMPHYCFEYGAEAYEFWGVSWLTQDPYKYGWHRYISQTTAPGEHYWVRYPNGDGYLLYPGKPIGHDGVVSSIRLEQAREGVEDYEYLY
ncbi:MAG: DUF4091 domain-containing protein, partial [Pirellulales bacterium]|nr:DUF4091 domain-containing protein [Pirellulales bacterium]